MNKVVELFIKMVNKQANKEFSKLKRTLHLYNMVPNLVWSVLNLAPISVFCYALMDRKSFYIFLAISIIPVFFPNSFFNKMQVGKTARTYKKLGVSFVNKFAQNGVIVNRLMKKKFPEYRSVMYQRSSVNRLLQQTYMFEKFHFVLFIFFTLVIVYALIKHYYWWTLIIIITNVLYNIYPNLLQQYIRLKLILYTKRMKAN